MLVLVASGSKKPRTELLTDRKYKYVYAVQKVLLDRHNASNSCGALFRNDKRVWNLVQYRRTNPASAFGQSPQRFDVQYRSVLRNDGLLLKKRI